MQWIERTEGEEQGVPNFCLIQDWNFKDQNLPLPIAMFEQHAIKMTLLWMRSMLVQVHIVAFHSRNTWFIFVTVTEIIFNWEILSSHVYLFVVGQFMLFVLGMEKQAKARSTHFLQFKVAGLEFAQCFLFPPQKFPDQLLHLFLMEKCRWLLFWILKQMLK